MQKYGNLEYYEFGKYDAPMAGNDAIRDECLAIVRELRKRMDGNTLKESGEAMLISYILSLTSRYAVRRRDTTLVECMRGYHMLDDEKKRREMVNVFLRFAGYTETRNVERLDLPIVHFLRSRHLRRPVIVLEKLAHNMYLMNRPFRYLLDWERDAKKQQDILNQMVKVRHEKSIDGRALSFFNTKKGEAFVKEDNTEVLGKGEEHSDLKKVSSVETEFMVINPSIERVKGEVPTLTGVYGAYYGSMLRWADTETRVMLSDNKQMARVIVTERSVVVGRLLTEVNREGISHGMVHISELENMFNKGIILCPTPWRPVVQNTIVPFSQHEETRIRNYWSRLKPGDGSVYWLARKEHRGDIIRHLYSSFDPVTVRIESSFDIETKSKYGKGDGSVVTLRVRTTSNIYDEPVEFFIREEFAKYLQRLKFLQIGGFVPILDQPFGEGMIRGIEENMKKVAKEGRYNMNEREIMIFLHAELFRYLLFEFEEVWRSPWNVWASLLKFAVQSEYYFDFVDLASKFFVSFMEKMHFHYDSMYNDILIHVDDLKREYMILYSTFNMLEDKIKKSFSVDKKDKEISRMVTENFERFHQMIWKIIGEFSVNESPSIPLKIMVQSFHKYVVFPYAGYMYLMRMREGAVGFAYEKKARDVVQYLRGMSN